MNISDLMSYDPVVCLENTSIQECACLMRDNNCGELPVVDSPDTRRLLGVVTERDIVVRLLAKGVDPLEATVEDCYTAPAISMREDSSVEECLDAMSQARVRRLPIIDVDGCCIGTVAQADLAKNAPARDAASLMSQISQTDSPSNHSHTPIQ